MCIFAVKLLVRSPPALWPGPKFPSRFNRGLGIIVVIEDSLVLGRPGTLCDVAADLIAPEGIGRPLGFW